MANPTASGLLGYFSNLVFENPKWDFSTFNFDSDMTHADMTIGPLGNATSTDYSAAERRGVKIIQYHGWNDQTLQPAYSPQYFDQRGQGERRTETHAEFYRLFMVPGMTHCNGGIGAANFGGVGPAAPAGARRGARSADCARELGRARRGAHSIHRDEVHRQRARRPHHQAYQRPMCLYPTVAHYRGTGDTNDASSFRLQDAGGAHAERHQLIARRWPSGLCARRVTDSTP